MRLAKLSRIDGLKVLCLFFAVITFLTHPAVALKTVFYAEDDVVINKVTGLKWARCSIGQTWSGQTCVGEVARLSVDDALDIAKQYNDKDGTFWRLPTRAELETLVCASCDRPKIDTDLFPGTSAEPYWTGESNNFVRLHNWSVNFFTGHSYGRFYPNQSLAVRLVQTF